MTRTFNNPVPLTPELEVRRDDWVRRVTALVEQISQWSREAGWQVELGRETIEERRFGRYEAPAARVQLPKGDLPERAVLVIPVALEVPGGDGRVDVEGYPTLSRVRLLGAGDGWIIMTDSNVPLRLPWNSDTFRQLAQDLVA
ncbi:MAG TPA: hypothetical protein VLJ39_15010 [Tepidisphaeraceae bacterium]|jgi:hypothetical protein|nr:hypothetical protein [Tepidisphaeraceae bacterium]